MGAELCVKTAEHSLGFGVHLVEEKMKERPIHCGVRSVVIYFAGGKEETGVEGVCVESICNFLEVDPGLSRSVEAVSIL